jgi:hypothetical protein
MINIRAEVFSSFSSLTKVMEEALERAMTESEIGAYGVKVSKIIEGLITKMELAAEFKVLEQLKGVLEFSESLNKSMAEILDKHKVTP